MIAFVKKWITLMMVIIIIANLFFSYENTALFNAYITAFCGWLIVLVDEFTLSSKPRNEE